MPLHLGPIGDAFAGGFGVVAALMLLGGPIALRWQRNRQQFLLMRAAVERGTSFPRGQPLWLQSLRQGMMTLTLGIALLLIGGAATALTLHVTAPTPTISTAALLPLPPRPPVDPATQPADAPATRPAPPAPPLRPPAPDPAMESYHRMQSINALGLLCLAAGVVLTLLGIARIAFARMEQRYEAPDA